jgi:hypothetical protein
VTYVVNGERGNVAEGKRVIRPSDRQFGGHDLCGTGYLGNSQFIIESL